MKTPFTISEDQVAYWRMAVGCKVIAGPTVFVVVAMPKAKRNWKGLA